MRPFPAPAPDPSHTPSRRWRRPSWRDPRLAGGLVLVGAAVALGSWAVDAAARTEPVYALARDVAPGTDLTGEGVLVVVDARPASTAYLSAGSLPEHAVATRAMAAGELLPVQAVSTTALQEARALVLTVSFELPQGAGTGDTVDLWVVPATSAVSGEASQPQAQMVAQGLVVSRVEEGGSTLMGASELRVEVLVPQDSVGTVLTAAGSGGSLVLVPTGQDG